MISGLVRGDPLHVLGVAGTAMASLAGLLARLGYRVTGSDQGAYPPMSTLLEREGIPVRSPYAPENLPPGDVAVVVGNAVSRGNPELEAALDRRLPLVSMPETLRELVLRPRRPVVIAGTHGKTTTTSLLAWILRVAGMDAGFLVGGVPQDFGTSFRLGGEGHPFVVEGDEYDTAYWDKGPKFLHYLPEVAVIGNVEFDHADIYADFAAVRRAFSFLARLPPRRGLLLLGADSPAALDLRRHAYTTVETFAAPPGAFPADWVGTPGESGPAGSRLEVRRRGEAPVTLEGPFWGVAAARNTVAATAVARWLGVEWDAVREAVRTFTGVARRLEVLGETADGSIRVVRDFAHHPTAATAILEAVRRRWPDARVVAAFEPRSYTSRSARFQADYARSFAAADAVLLASPAGESRGRRPGGGGLDLDRLAAELSARGVPASVHEDHASVASAAAEQASGKDPVVLLFLSNGYFGGAPEAAARELGANR